MPVDEKLYPLASVRVYDVGAGDPVVSDSGHDWYDVLSDTAMLGSFSRDYDGGYPDLEIIKGIGIACHPFLMLQDTRLAQFDVLGGEWSEFRPITGAPRRYRLVQWSAQPNAPYTATSAYVLPDNPALCLSWQTADLPGEQDTQAFRPYVRFLLGGLGSADNPTEDETGAWQVEYTPAHGLWLLRYDRQRGAYAYAAQIEGGQEQGAKAGERYLYFRVQQGKILLSTDFGRNYTVYRDPGGKPITVRKAKFLISGCGYMAQFGVHQLFYGSGVYTSPRHSTHRKRAVNTELLLDYGGTKTAQQTVELSPAPAAEGETERDFMQYRLRLCPDNPPDATMGLGWQVYRSPDVATVTARYPVESAAATLTYQTPWEGKIREIRIDKPEQLDQGAATITLRLDTAEAARLQADNWRFRRVEVLLGEHRTDGTDALRICFTGYTRNVKVMQEQPNEVLAVVTCENATAPARHQEWESIRPYGGMTVNTALNAILDSIPVPPERRAWDTAGDSITLPPGSAAEPSFMPKPGEVKWTLLEKIANHAGLEIGADDDGVWYTAPRDYVSSEVLHTWQAIPQDSLEQLLRQVSYEMDAGESFTAILVVGKDEQKRPVRAAADSRREMDPAYRNYSPWRLPHVEQLSESTSTTRASKICIALYGEKIPLRLTAETESAVTLGVGRRDRVRVTGTQTGIGDGDDLIVRTLAHLYRADPSFATLSTTATLRKVQ